MTLRHSHQCCGKPCRSRTGGASGFPASATCIRRPVESVTNAWVTPGSSGISVGCAQPDAAGRRGASGVSVTTPMYYIRTTNSPPATCGARALVHHGPLPDGFPGERVSSMDPLAGPI
jgi:hypothetical protein